MKKIGMMVLLTVGYTAALTWLFSTDFGRANSFLVSPEPVQGKALGAPVMREFAASTRLKTTAASTSSQQQASSQAVTLNEQSPESAVEH